MRKLYAASMEQCFNNIPVDEAEHVWLLKYSYLSF